MRVKSLHDCGSLLCELQEEGEVNYNEVEIEIVSNSQAQSQIHRRIR